MCESFNLWLESNYLPVLSQLLWYKLIHLFNISGWAKWIQVDNQRLMSALQIKREQTFIECRNKLIEKNLIEYEKGKKGVPSKYKINTFKNAGNSVVQTVGNGVVKSVVETVDIYKQNKTKQNKESIAKAIPKKKFGEFKNVLLTEAEYERLKADYGEELPGIIEHFGNYIEMKGYKAKSHNLAIRNWAVTAYREKIQREISLENRQKEGMKNAVNSGNAGVKSEFKEYPEYDTYGTDDPEGLAEEIRRIKEKCAKEQSVC